MDVSGPTWNTMIDILLERLRSGGGGFVIFGRAFVKRGVRPNPLNPLWLRAWIRLHYAKCIRWPPRTPQNAAVGYRGANCFWPMSIPR